MAFNVNDYVKSTAKTVANRLINNLTTSASTAGGSNLLSSASNISQALFNVGASFESISSLASQQTDALVSSGASVFYKLAGKDTTKVIGSDISSTRRANLDDINVYLTQINPSTKIASKRKSDSSVIIDAVM